jgi:hypothetical protein
MGCVHRLAPDAMTQPDRTDIPTIRQAIRRAENNGDDQMMQSRLVDLHTAEQADQ